MPVDYFILLMPVIFGFSLLIGLTSVNPKTQKYSFRFSWLMAFLFFCFYFLPGLLVVPGVYFGNAKAQYELGEYYSYTCPWTNLEDGKVWYLKSAENGYPLAMDKVGYFYVWNSGNVIPHDILKAKYWLEKAEAAGNQDAVHDLKMLEDEQKKESGKR